MSDSTSGIVKNFEDLIRKTADANKIFISEGSKFVKQFTSSPEARKDIPGIQTDALKDAFSAFVKLNMQHASNLVDLGLELTKKFNGSTATEKETFKKATTAEEETFKPAFVLKATASPGATIMVPFLLDSDKKEPMLCNLVYTDFVHQNDFSIKPDFKTTFLPQSFQLNPSASQKVDIQVMIPVSAKPGIYLSHLQVQGFEQAFFSLYITVSDTSPL